MLKTHRDGNETLRLCNRGVIVEQLQGKEMSLQQQHKQLSRDLANLIHDRMCFRPSNMQMQCCGGCNSLIMAVV